MLAPTTESANCVNRTIPRRGGVSPPYGVIILYRAVGAGQVSSFATTEDMFAALRKGYVDAVCGHEALVAGWISTETIAYRLLDESPLKTELGVAFAKGTHAELSLALTQTLEQMQYDGTMGRILEKYGIDAQKATEGDGNA